MLKTSMIMNIYKETSTLLPDVNNAQRPSSWQPFQLSTFVVQPEMLKPNM